MVITSYLENRYSRSHVDNLFSKLLVINAECQYLSKSMTAIEWWAILFYILPSNCLLIPVQARQLGQNIFSYNPESGARTGQGRARSDTEILQSPGEDMFCFPM